MPPLALAMVAGYAIFLDLKADRYLLLEASLNDAAARLLAGEQISAEIHSELAETLGRSITSADLVAMTVSSAPQDFEAAIGSTATVAIRLMALVHLVAAWLTLRCYGLHRSLRVIEARARRSLSPLLDKQLLPKILAGHIWLSRHVTAHDACLLRTLALARHALSRDCRIQLTIGVKAHPFGAHCWVSAGNTLLNEDPDSVAPFTPILVVQ